MPVASFGVLDLSLVTDVLKNVITSCPQYIELNKKFTITVTGNAPDVSRGTGCTLSLFLFNVQKNGHQSNALNLNPANATIHRAQRVPYQPLSLDLLYLLTTFSDVGYVQEQQAMSAAIRCLYEHPIVTTAVPFPGGAANEQFTLPLEVDPADQIGRLWQATRGPIRHSPTYKVTVGFIAPAAPPPAIPLRTHL